MKYWQKDGDSTTAIMKFYGEISVWFNGANDFTSTMQEIEAAYKRLEIKVHCYGGQVFEGNVIFNAIRNSKLEVEIIIDGVAASMMSIVMLAARKVTIAENGYIMIHVPSGYTAGNANDHFATGKLLKSMQVNFSREYIRKTGKQQRDVDGWFDGSDHWFDATEAKAIGLVDEIAAPVVVSASSVKPDAGTAIQSVFDRYTSLLSKPQQQKIMDKQSIISQFALTGMTAASSDADVIAALNSKYTVQEQRIQSLENSTKQEKKARVDSLIAGRAKALGVTFTDDQIKGFEAAAEAGLNVLGAVLEAMQPAPQAPQILDLLKGGKSTVAGNNDLPTDRKDWDWDTWQQKDPNGLEALSRSTPEAFSKIYLAKYPKGAADLA